MLSAILFDFGGTLDADGLHWLDRFYRIYERIGLGHIPKPAIKEAFYWADAQAELEPAMRKADLRDMMQRHVRWQFQKLGLDDPQQEAAAALAFEQPAERVLRRNRRVLEKLHFEGLRLGVISNFYGNIETLCREFGFFDYLDVVLDSIVVGVRKPEPAVFQMALDKLGVPASEVAYVGDSFERDVLPAKGAGMKTIWLIGDTGRAAPDPAQVDYTLLSLEDLPNLVRRLRPAPKL